MITCRSVLYYRSGAGLFHLEGRQLPVLASQGCICLDSESTLIKFHPFFLFLEILVRCLVLFLLRDCLGPGENTEMTVRDLFTQLKTKSLLEALNNTKLIEQMQFNEIVHLLENQPTTGRSNEQNDVDNVVTREREEQNNMDNVVTRERDTFYCYYVLKKFVSLLQCCASGR